VGLEQKRLMDFFHRAFPTAVTLVFASFLSLSVKGVWLPQPVVTPVPVEGEGPEQLLTPAPYLNSMIMVSMIFLGSVLILFLLRYYRLLRIIINLVVFVSSSAATVFYLFLLSDLPETHIYILSLFAGLIVAVSISSKSEVAGVLAASYLASAVGVLLGVSIPYWTALAVLTVVALYDVLAVFKGHLRNLHELDTGRIKGLVVDFRGVTLGLGDLIFYSLLFSMTFNNLGMLSAFAAAFGIMMGYFLTLRMALRHPVFPALPIPLLVGLIFSFIPYFLL